MMKKRKNPSFQRITEIESVMEEIRSFLLDLYFQNNPHVLDEMGYKLNRNFYVPGSISMKATDIRDLCFKRHHWRYVFLNIGPIPLPSSKDLKNIVSRNHFVKQDQYLIVKNEETAIKLRLGMSEGVVLKIFDMMPNLSHE